MSGIGSGRGFQGGKVTTSNMLALDVRQLHREGLLIPGRTFDIHWKLDGENQATIKLEAEFDFLTLSYRSLIGFNVQDMTVGDTGDDLNLFRKIEV